MYINAIKIMQMLMACNHALPGGKGRERARMEKGEVRGAGKTKRGRKVKWKDKKEK